MPKGVCCAAQAAGDLGKPIKVQTKSGGVRCGVCEVRPSCRDPQKVVFAFRLLPPTACKLPATSKCAPTAAGIAQYNAVRNVSATTGQTVYSDVIPMVPAPGVGIGAPYVLPPS